MQEIAIENEDESQCLDHAIVDEGLGESEIKFKDSLYYSSKTETLLSNLKDFTLGQNSSALLLGALSGGKTTLLKILQSQLTFTCQFVQGFTKLDYSRLLPASLSAMHQDAEHPITSDSLLVILNNLQDNFLLIIDDADFLSMDNLQGLLLAFSKQTAGKAKLLLAGEGALLKRVEALSERLEIPFNSQIFQVEPLSAKEAAQYLKHMMSPSFSNIDKLLSKKNIDKILTLSEGYMGRINRIAMQLASDQMDLLVAKKPRRFSFVDILLTVAIVCLLGVVGLRITQLFSQERRSNQPAFHSITKKDLPPVQALPVNRPEENLQTYNEETTPSFIASIQNLPEEILVKGTPADASLVLPVPAYTPGYKKKSLTSINGQSYTLELIASPQKQALINWIHSHPGHSYQMMSRQSHGKPTFILTYGSFTTKTKAKEALSKLPKLSKPTKPIIRSEKSLKRVSYD